MSFPMKHAQTPAKLRPRADTPGHSRTSEYAGSSHFFVPKKMRKTPWSAVSRGFEKSAAEGGWRSCRPPCGTEMWTVCSELAAELCPGRKPWRPSSKPRRGMLRSEGRALSCVKTAKTSSSTRTTKCWNVSVIGSRSRNLETTSSGTSTNCSAVCSTLGNLRVGRAGNDIFNTSITCSGSGKWADKSSANGWSTFCRIGTSRVGNEQTASKVYSTVRRRNRSCGPTS